MRIKHGSLILEGIVVLFAIGMMFHFGAGPYLDHQLNHKYPYGYFASDAFWYYNFAHTVYTRGNFKYYPHYIALGFDNIVGTYPPLLPQASASLAYQSGIPDYVTNFLLQHIFAILFILSAYIIIRKISPLIAMLSIPVSLMLYSQTFNIQFFFGNRPHMIANFFLVVCAFLLYNRDLKYFSVALGISIAGLTTVQTASLPWLILVMAVFVGISLLYKKMDWREISPIFFGVVLGLILSGYYAILFKISWVQSSGSPFVWTDAATWTGGKAVLLENFGLPVLFLFGAGIILYVFLMKKKNFLPFSLFSIMVLVGFTNYGLGAVGIKARYFWPVYFAFFTGISLYFLLNWIPKKVRTLTGVAVSIIGVIMIVSATYPDSASGSGLMDPYHWNALMFLKDNTPKDANVLFFYGDPYEQPALLISAEREVHKVILDDVAGYIRNQTVGRYYQRYEVSEYPRGFPYQKNGWFSFGYYQTERPEILDQFTNDLCNFSYVVFDHVGRIPVLIQYNNLIKSLLLKKPYITQVYQNEVLSILHNEKPGEECIVQEKFNIGTTEQQAKP